MKNQCRRGGGDCLDWLGEFLDLSGGLARKRGVVFLRGEGVIA